MQTSMTAFDKRHKTRFKLFNFRKVILASLLSIFFLSLGVISAKAQWPQIVESKDGTPISYEMYGTGEPTLVFVHGWNCDSRYWREQIQFFSQKNRIVVLDLAGHGHSGSGRSKYTMRSFGEDIKAVADACGGKNFILIGHSMAGIVIAEAARLMPERTVGLIGIDTIENIEYVMTAKEMEQMVSPLEKDFRSGTKNLVGQMFSPNTDPSLREWVLADMSSATPAVALSAMREMLLLYTKGEPARLFDDIRIPVMTVNGDMWPVNHEANRRHMPSFDAIIIKGADHFLMMTQPKEFNIALKRAIDTIVKNPSR